MSLGGQDGRICIKMSLPHMEENVFHISLATGGLMQTMHPPGLFLPSHSFSSVFTGNENPCIQVKQQACIFFHPSLKRIPAGRSHLATSRHRPVLVKSEKSQRIRS